MAPHVGLHAHGSFAYRLSLPDALSARLGTRCQRALHDLGELLVQVADPIRCSCIRAVICSPRHASRPEVGQHLSGNSSKHMQRGEGDSDESQAPAVLTEGLISIRAIVRELRRRRRLWLLTAAVGLAVGLALPIAVPLGYSATTLLYLSHNPALNPVDAMLNDVTLLQTEAVADQAVRQLGGHETAAQLLSQYSGLSLSSELLQIKATAPSATGAVRKVNAVATAFLLVRAHQLERQTDAVTRSIQAAEAGLQSQIDTLRKEIAAAGPVRGSSSGVELAAELAAESNQLAALAQTIQQNASSAASVNAGSTILQPGLLAPHSHLKPFAKDGAIGLLGGWILGLGWVAVSTITSDRVRRREEFATVLDSPVELSVHRFRNPRWLRLRRLRRQLRKPDRAVRLSAGFLRKKLSPAGGRMTLGVVAVDSLEASAVFVGYLASRLADEGTHVGVIDLSEGALLARLLRDAPSRAVGERGPRSVTPISVLVAPDESLLDSADGKTAAGLPFDSPFGDGPNKMSRSVELVLVLATLDPALGAAQLAAWASEVVLVVSTGRSNAVKLRAAAEMIRAAGCQLDSVLVVGADRDDESLGRPTEDASAMRHESLAQGAHGEPASVFRS